MRSHRLLSALVVVCLVLACGGDKEAAQVTPSGPIVNVLDLAVSLRSGGTAPSDFHDVEVSAVAVNVGGAPALTLTDGLVAAADRQGDALPKLSSALGTPQRTHMVLSVSSSVSYSTVSLVLATAKAAGVRSVAFKVRPPGGGANTGFLTLDNVDVRPRSKADDEVPIAGVAPKPWAAFAGQWEAVQSACRASQSGNCAFKPEKVAEGGNLKISLYAAGQGANVGFFRVGAPPDEPAAATDKKSSAKTKSKSAKHEKKGKKKPELIDGVKAPLDPLAELEQEPPATQALFQFRSQEALTAPSAVTGTMQPVCGGAACGVVVQAEKTTLFVRVLALIGAAFPDGSAAPTVVFELP